MFRERWLFTLRQFECLLSKGHHSKPSLPALTMRFLRRSYRLNSKSPKYLQHFIMVVCTPGKFLAVGLLNPVRLLPSLIQLGN